MGYMKTNYISFNILDFLESQKTTVDNFRSLWQVCDWENKINVNRENCTINQYITLLMEKLKLTVIDDLSITTQKLNTFCFYTRFVLGKDLLVNLSIESEENGVNGHLRIRSQNMGVVVMTGK